MTSEDGSQTLQVNASNEDEQPSAAPAKTVKSKEVGKKKAPVQEEAEKPKDEPIVLDARLGIQNIAALVDQLAPALQVEGAIKLDVANVASVDTAALQVLVAFANSVRAQTRVLEWCGTSDAISEFSELADLSRHLQPCTPPAVEEDDGLCPVF